MSKETARVAATVGARWERRHPCRRGSSAPLVTATMVSHNNALFIREAIESVISQEYKEWELLILESGSSDNTYDIIEERARGESRIRAERVDELISVPEARNRLLAESTGSYIANIDGDDVWLPQRLSRQVAFMESGAAADHGVCGANCRLIDAAGAVIGTKRFPSTHSECLRVLWHRNPFCHSATLVRRCCFDRSGGFDPRFEVAEDLELWFRLARGFAFANLNEVLVKYRLSRAGATFRRHRRMIQRTLQARRLAWSEYGYRRNLAARLSYGATWCMGWLPPRLVHRIFYDWVLATACRTPRNIYDTAFP